MYQKYYQRFMEAQRNQLHFAAHSHHYWPDVTRDAVLEYWDDSSQYVDRKWEYFFANKIPKTQKLIAEVLGFDDYKQIAFAPNTHEFVYRLLSCFSTDKKIKILTTDSEFHSFDRQINRLIEEQMVEVVKVPTYPFDSFKRRFLLAAEEFDPQMVFISHVFFNSGFVFDGLEDLLNILNSKTMVVIDGYHGFMALPCKFTKWSERIFYIAGSYKYAQGGEGCCFMYVPQKYVSDHNVRPRYTGWFAGFADLQSGQDHAVTYSNDGYRFAGSTMDYSALYRLCAVLELFKNESISVDIIHNHVRCLQRKFIKKIQSISHSVLNTQNLQMLSFDLSNDQHGHFLTFAAKNADEAQFLCETLLHKNVIVDRRDNRIRFGFAIYHDLDMTFSFLDEI